MFGCHQRKQCLGVQKWMNFLRKKSSRCLFQSELLRAERQPEFPILDNKIWPPSIRHIRTRICAAGLRHRSHISTFCNFPVYSELLVSSATNSASFCFWLAGLPSPWMVFFVSEMLFKHSKSSLTSTAIISKIKNQFRTVDFRSKARQLKKKNCSSPSCESPECSQEIFCVPSTQDIWISSGLLCFSVWFQLCTSLTWPFSKADVSGKLFFHCRPRRVNSASKELFPWNMSHSVHWTVVVTQTDNTEQTHVSGYIYKSFGNSSKSNYRIQWTFRWQRPHSKCHPRKRDTFRNVPPEKEIGNIKGQHSQRSNIIVDMDPNQFLDKPDFENTETQ